MKFKKLLYLFMSIAIFVFAMKSLRAGENKNANGGKIIGKVTYSGAIKAPKKMEITKDVKICGQVEHFNESMLVSKDKGIANVIVGLSGVKGGKDMTSLGTDFVIDQNGCQFIPHVLLVPTGTQLKIKNSDGILHNIHTFSEKNQAVNKAQPRFMKVVNVSFKEPEVIRVACDVHNWMGGYIGVVDHPYHALTDENGDFEFADVPAGTYTIEYWHEVLGKQSQEVTVNKSGSTDAAFEFKESK